MIDIAIIEARLRIKAREFLKLSAQLAALVSLNPKVSELRRVAGGALAKGDFDAADEALADAERIDREQAKEHVDNKFTLLTSAADSRAKRGAVARVRLDYLAAAEHFAEAARIVAPLGRIATWQYLLEEASNLKGHGREHGDNEALRLAIARYRTTLDQVLRADRPNDWALTQNNLGNALRALGHRESGSNEPELESAVADVDTEVLEAVD